jgi:hypothetical protein
MFEGESRKVNLKVVAPFLAFNGITSNEGDYGIKGFNAKDSKLLDINNPTLESNQASIYQNALNDSMGGKDKADITGAFGAYHTWGGGDIIAGTVYVPLTDDQISVYSFNNAARIPKTHA